MGNFVLQQFSRPADLMNLHPERSTLNDAATFEKRFRHAREDRVALSVGSCSKSAELSETRVFRVASARPA